MGLTGGTEQSSKAVGGASALTRRRWQPPQVPRRATVSEPHGQWCTVRDMRHEARAEPLDHRTGSAGLETGEGGWHKASVLSCLPLVASIGLSPLHIQTLCGSERGLVVSTEPPDDLSCLTTSGVGRPGDGLLPVPLTGCIQMRPPSPCGGLPTPAPTCAGVGVLAGGGGGSTRCRPPLRRGRSCRPGSRSSLRPPIWRSTGPGLWARPRPRLRPAPRLRGQTLQNRTSGACSAVLWLC